MLCYFIEVWWEEEIELRSTLHNVNTDYLHIYIQRDIIMCIQWIVFHCDIVVLVYELALLVCDNETSLAQQKIGSRLIKLRRGWPLGFKSQIWWQVGGSFLLNLKIGWGEQ